MLLPSSPSPRQLAVLEAALRDSDEKSREVQRELGATQDHAHSLETRLASTQDQLLEVERSREVAEGAGNKRLGVISELQWRLEEAGTREGLVAELQEQVTALQEQLDQLQSEVGGVGGWGLKRLRQWALEVESISS